MRALVSVSDKTGLLPFVQGLVAWGIEIISTGGTAKYLRDNGITVIDVANVTKFPEILDGRVKTLHPKIHGGILARRKDSLHQEAMQKHGITPIDMVVVNLYPFADVMAQGHSWEHCVENIDIGGPAMLRAAAKNYEDVTVVTSPNQYDLVLEAVKENNGSTDLSLRRLLAQHAFTHTARYDARVAAGFAEKQGDLFPETLIQTASLRQVLRYGENPHQKAAFYVTDAAVHGVANAQQLQGKELSYNNINDTDAAFALAAEFDDPAVVIVKHANPCGVAVGKSQLEAYHQALACDPVSAFGGIVAFNRAVDRDTAIALSQLFLEVIIAPAFSHEAEVVLATKKNVRLLVTGGMPDRHREHLRLKTLSGGLLVQTSDTLVTSGDLQVVTKRQPSRQEISDLLFAFTVAKHVKSNAIVYAKNLATVGIGAGQMSRVDAARIAVHKAEDIAANAGQTKAATHGSVVASDAFFPFADGLLTAIAAGATAVIQPGGSVRDNEVIAAADSHGVSMVFTGVRHFAH